MKKILIALLIILIMNIGIIFAESSPESKDVSKDFNLDTDMVKLSASKLDDVTVWKIKEQIWVKSKNDFKLEFFDKDGKTVKSYSGFKSPKFGENRLIFDKD